ncbi:MAG: hypothetical protein J7604_18300 [Sporocytophaga sp.]|uniref:hypothetical protein n=1 Tax=Sporocytophaga sp. TaxID=2231183 RepID=UPI001B235FE0|nr:hypothetical protein [Sporocytophaga sp.]MBO9702167.1 hypothetical protein [Sporocytophaga sp.]
MKHIIIASLMVLVAQVSFAQNGVNNDPTYSINNYKQANKAKYAKENNLGNPVSIETSEVTVKENYKNSFSSGKTSKKASSYTYMPLIRSSRSYKHPNGL